jgi:hypothetical protein
MNVVDLRRVTFSLAGLIAIAGMFGLTCYSLYFNRTASGTVAGSMTLALVIMRQLHLLENFEILSLKAKFAARVNEAEKLLAFIRRSATVSSKISYVQLAFMNRMGDIGWTRKRSLLNDVDTLLREIDVPEPEIKGMKVPFLNLVSLDLSRVFEHSVNELMKPQRDAVEAEIRAYSSKPIAGDDPQWSALLERQRSLSRSPIKWSDALGNENLANIQGELTPWLSNISMDFAAKEKADIILAEVVRLSKDCWSVGSITSEAEQYLNLYSGRTDARLNALTREQDI